MSMQKAQRQMPVKAGREAVGQGEALSGAFSDEAFHPRHATGDAGSALLQAALTTENLRRAFKRVRANKGAAGVDDLDINQTSRYLAAAWPSIREQLLAGTYRPSPVRRMSIPKPDGGEHWKRGTTMYRELLKLGAAPSVAKRVAANSRCWWRNSDRLLETVMTIAYFDRLGVPRLS